MGQMGVTKASESAGGGRMTIVYEWIDPPLLDRLWFIALSDGTAVQLLAPTFRSERAARLFERCVLEHPGGTMLSIDGQLELARRVEGFVESAGQDEAALKSLCSDLSTDPTS
ncbi:MAG: hypothetical protein JO022_19445 [Acidobacteriaceae bacterium]|nr:hypothetical protein [Acidobacteriaceae bacterium]